MNRDSSLRGPQEPQDLGGWMAPQALLDPQGHLGTPAYRALLASRESLAWTDSGACQEL